MISKCAVNMSIPPLIFAAAYMFAVVSARLSQEIFLALQFPLSMLILGSWVASTVAMTHLLPVRKNPDLRLPLVLNSVALTVLVVMLLLIVIRKLPMTSTSVVP
jgi:hypothetical protein